MPVVSWDFRPSDFLKNGETRRRHCGGLPVAKSDPASRPALRGVLTENSASVLMQILYTARYARFGLLCAVAQPAQHIFTWEEDCGKGIYRLMCYVHGTLHWCQMGYMGDT